MYFVYLLILFVGVYLAPALAINPNLWRHPLGWAVIPMLSVATVVTAAFGLFMLGALSHSVVLVLTVLTVAVAAYRLARRNYSEPIHWDKSQLWSALAIMVVCLPLAVRLGMTSFATNDEIYSWNMWAIQFYLGEPPDLHYTTVPYPQGFSLLLAWCYALLGDIELQTPVRFALGVFPVAMCIAVVASTPKSTRFYEAKFLLLLLVWLFFTASKSHLDNGLADPMMAAALITSAACYIHWLRNGGAFWVWVAVITACLAAMTKQPAVLWAGIAMPVLLIISQPKRLQTWMAVAVLVGIPGLWALTAGYGSWSNQGVVAASQVDRSLGEQLIFAARTYLVSKPAIALMLIAAAYGAHKTKGLALLFWFAAVPMLAGWFLFGAYDMRLGLHVVAVFALLIAASGFAFPLFDWPAKAWDAAGQFIRRHLLSLVGVLALLSITASALIVRARWDDMPYLLKGGHMTVRAHFGDQATWIMESLYDQDERLIWAPSNYVYGIFYGQAPVMYPGFGDARNYTLQDMTDELLDNRVSAVVDVPGRLGDGNAAELLKELRQSCPQPFAAVGEPGGKHGFQMLTVNTDALANCRNIAW